MHEKVNIPALTPGVWWGGDFLGFGNGHSSAPVPRQSRAKATAAGSGCRNLKELKKATEKADCHIFRLWNLSTVLFISFTLN